MALGLKGGRMLVKLSAAKAGTMRNSFHSLASKKKVLDTERFSKAHIVANPLPYIAGAGIFCFAKLSAEEAAVEDVVPTESSKAAEEAIKATEEEAAKKLEEEKEAAEKAAAAESARLAAKEAAEKAAAAES